MISDDRAEVLEPIILKLYRSLEPIIAVKIHDDAALVETVMRTGEISFYDEREVFFLGFRL